MRRKRFKHYAHVLCDMFCGWEKHPDDPLFASRPGGVIAVDVLHESAMLDGQPHTFATLKGIRRWFMYELEANHIPAEAVSDARIELQFLCNHLPDSPNPGYELHFWGRGLIVSGQDRYDVPYKKSERYERTL